MPPNRLETLTIGLPSVFHTAPPQPASNARITWSPELVGGADASQNGFGDLMPEKSMLRSAMDLFPCHASVNLSGRDAPVGDRVDDFFAAVHAIAAAINLGVLGPLRLGIDEHAT